SVTDDGIYFQTNIQKGTRMKPVPLLPRQWGHRVENRNTIFTTIKKLTLALVIAVVMNVPAAEAILIPLPGGGLQSGVLYIIRISANVTDVAVMLQAVVRNRLELEETGDGAGGG